MSSDNVYPFESKMDLPAPRPAGEVPTNPEQPVVKQGSEVNPEFLPPVSNDNPNPPVQAQAAAQAQAVAPLTSSHTVGTQTTQAPQTSAATNPDLAEDVDLIEKEWVDKAKAIVNHTKDDPRRQNVELNKMKADYIKKRYNRDVQVSE